MDFKKALEVLSKLILCNFSLKKKKVLVHLFSSMSIAVTGKGC